MDDIIDNLYVNRELYAALFNPICSKYNLTMTEMLVLLFLATNTCYNTASDIVEKLKITKSHVSASVRDLSERGYLHGNYEGDNRRTIHLHLCDKSSEIIKEGKRVQEEFLTVISRGFTEEEKKKFRDYIKRINDNANEYLKERFNSKGGERQHAGI